MPSIITTDVKNFTVSNNMKAMVADISDIVELRNGNLGHTFNLFNSKTGRTMQFWFSRAEGSKDGDAYSWIFTNPKELPGWDVIILND